MFLFFWLRGMFDLSSFTRDRSCTPCIGRQSLNHWTAREVPMVTFLTCFPPVVPSLFLDNLVPKAYIFFFHKQLTQHLPSLPP